VRKEKSTVTGQCSILYINTDGFTDTQASALRALGFDVVEADDVPARDTLAKYHALVVRMPERSRLTSVAARLRAAPLFGRRVLIALVSASVTVRERREAIDCGFDLVLPHQCSARDLAASILSLLRRYPEHRCVLRSHNNRRRAAA
jgi:DNA-binding response OmpR family regulator